MWCGVTPSFGGDRVGSHLLSFWPLGVGSHLLSVRPLGVVGCGVTPSFRPGRCGAGVAGHVWQVWADTFFRSTAHVGRGPMEGGQWGHTFVLPPPATLHKVARVAVIVSVFVEVRLLGSTPCSVPFVHRATEGSSDAWQDHFVLSFPTPSTT